MSLRPRAIAALTCAAALLASSSAAAFNPYVFNNMCAPESVYDTTIGPPDVLIILDRSGSMGEDSDGDDCIGESDCKWEVAKDSIKDLISATQASGDCDATDDSGCDEIKLGFGYYSGNADVVITPQEDSGSTIETWLDDSANNPDGGTNTGDAAEEIRGSMTLAKEDSVGIGVIITDGRPSNNGTVVKARNELCGARDRVLGPVSTYMIGFGSGSDANMNSYMAAAGGTGKCCESGTGCIYDADTITLTAGVEVDPCVEDVGTLISGRDVKSDYQCFGSIEAGNASALKSALLKIAAEAACTFPIEVPVVYPGAPSAPEDPFATRVTLAHSTFGNIDVQPFVASSPNLFYDYLISPEVGESLMVAAPYQGEGWVFATSARTSARLTPGLCADIKSKKITQASTQVACAAPDAGSDLFGANMALQGAAATLCPDAGGPCRVPCGTDPGAACEASGTFQVGRCGDGLASCQFNSQICTQQFTAQPEICNGIDDNCNGSTDDVDTAETEWDAMAFPLNDSSEMALFCGFRNTCTCGQAPGNSGAVPGPMDTEWSLLLAGGTGSCACGSGLEGEGEDVFSDPFVDPAEWGEDASDDEDGGCSTGGSLASGAGGIGFALMLALVAGFRRRERL